MKGFTRLPKVLPVRDKMEYEQRIPKIIWQTMKTNLVPDFMNNYAATWIRENPEYEYRFYDDDDIIDFIKSDFPAYLNAYNRIKYGASKADLWRYLIIYKYGGVYADIDCRCINPLRQWVDPRAVYVTQLGINKDLCQWLIISAPENPIFLMAAQEAKQNIENKTYFATYHGFVLKKGKLALHENEPIKKVYDKVFGLAGTPVLQEASEKCFNEGSIDGILAVTQIVCVSGASSCQMNGNVAHDCGNTEYHKALKILKTPYYGHFVPRTIRKFYGFLNRSITF